ncbi:MAG: NAD(P)-dependent alcohol dehydrogenase [Gammaproteobacteria bacterium]|nr:NAD(P)-dependent alcohol dehydrogenase [Pseudomonadales bacterium]MCP5348252.1 NAD(P)-dependent alcohol dehydrogenase [Pseudomonadales bacterium]
MKAVIWTRYGPPETLVVREMDKPEPRAGEVLIRNSVANIFAGDAELRRFQMHALFWLPIRLVVGVFRPRIKILGQEFAGTIEAVGEGVSDFAPGDRVFAPTGLGGAYAEFLCQKTRWLTRIPDDVSFDEAACIAVGGSSALHFLRVGQVKAGDKVLLNGAGGSIGTLAVQLAKLMGAEVTAVDHHRKLSTLLGLGADHVVDYEQEDFADRESAYDVIVDIVGKASYSPCLKALKPGGYLVLGNAPSGQMLRRFWGAYSTDRKVRIAIAGYHREDLEYLATLLAEEKIKPVIERSYTIEQMVEAHRYLDSGRKTGNVLLQMATDAD